MIGAHKIRLRFAFASALFALVALLPGGTNASSTSGGRAAATKPMAGNDNSAVFVRDQGDIAIIELSGNYDRNLPGGGVNYDARAVLAREFLRTHPDAYDMLVVFTGFQINTGAATAFYSPIQNKVQGIGKEIFDNSAHFGSAGKLLGTIDMADLGRYKLDTLDKGFEFGMMVFAHEFLHQYAAYVKYRKPDGSLSTGLLGSDGAHWSYLLDSNASVLYGSRWRDNGDGTFTATATRDAYSPLDLYLMGLKPKEDVPPFFLIDAPGVDPTQFPLPGATVTGTRRMVTVDDIIAAEGPRIPDFQSSQKEFRLAFVYAIRPGQNVSEQELAAMGNARRALGTRFSALTGGTGHMNVFTEPRSVATPGTPAVLPPPSSPPAASVNIQQAVAWLKLHQLPDGSWSDTAPTAIRDSAVSLLALSALDSSYPGLVTGAQWLSGRETASTDFLSRKIGALSQVNRAPVGNQAADLLAAQNNDGGWGAATGYSSNPLDTALAIQTLARRNTAVDTTATRAFGYLRDKQNADGGWGNVAGGTSRTTTSAQVLVALLGDTSAQTSLERGKTFIAGRQNIDGGFGDSPSSVHDTANVIASLMAINSTSGVRFNDAMQYLSVNQRVDGSWLSSVYSTALAVNVLARANAMNWAITGLTASPTRVTDGQRVTLSVSVTNTGNRNTPVGKLRVYAGDPAAGGVAIGADADIPVLVAGASATVSITWNTLGKAGSVSLYAVVDPERSQTELSTSDNTATLHYTIDPPSSTPDLLVSAADISVSPAHPSSIPSTVTITALLTNAGAGDTSNVKVVLWEGVGAQRTKAGETTIASFPGRSTRPVEFSTTLTRAGATSYTVEIDPDKTVAESDETNNSASISVSTEVGIDLEVLAVDITADKPSPRNGEDVQFSVKLRNRGTVPTSDFTVRYTMMSPSGTTEIASNVIRLNAGQQVTQTVPYRTTQTGAHTLTVDIDSTEAVTEGNESNNRAQYTFTVASDTGPSLAVSFQDITATPSPALEGSPLAISALIRNVGSQNAANVEVSFYAGNPAQSGVRIGALQTIPNLAAGAAQLVSVNWTNVPDAASKVIFVVVDPDNKIAADTTREDNRAFITVPVKSLPDLAVTTGNLVLAPAVPKPGDSVSLQVRVDNLGQQAASDVLVRVYDGDPDAGGVQVGGDKILPSIATQASATATFAWTFPASAGDRVLHVRVDPLQAVNERIRTNNAAQITVGVQSGDATVSTRYFSPNGDGVLDTVDFTFRLQSARTVSIQVMNSAGTIVRRYSGTDLSGVSAGRFTWDGRNDTGSVVRDDSYRLQVIDGTAVFGEAAVVLDTNRSSLVEAFGTQFASYSIFACAIPYNQSNGPPRVVEDGSRAYIQLYPSSRPDSLPAGIYRTNAFGTELRQVVPAPPEPHAYWNKVLPNQDGSKLVIWRGGDQISSDLPLWISNGEGKELRSLDLPLSIRYANFEEVGFLLSGNELLVKTHSTTEVKLFAVSLSVGGGTRTIATLTSSSTISNTMNWTRSPDGSKLILAIYTDDETRFVVVDLLTGTHRDAAFIERFSNSPVWSPDSRAFAILSRDGAAIRVYDADGNLQRTAVPAVTGIVRGILWGDDSSALYFDSGSGSCDTRAECGLDVAFHRLSVASGQVSQLYKLPGQVDSYEVYSSVRMAASRVPGQAQFIVHYPRGSDDAPEPVSGDHPEWFTISAEAPHAVRPMPRLDGREYLFLERAIGAYIDQSEWHGDGFSGFAEFGRVFRFYGESPANDAGGCYPHGGDYQTVRSLKNLTADLRATRTASVLKFDGIATDANFARYSLEYARTSAPGAWQPIAAVSNMPVISGELAQWVPPGPGSYQVRLTVEDLAGNRKEVVRNVSWGANSLISDLSRAPEYISPNGDGVQDKTVFRYRVLEPVNLVFNIYDSQGARVATATRAHPAIGVEAEFEWDGRNASGGTVADGVYKLTVLDYEFAIKVDTTSPAALLRQGETSAPMARLELRLGDVSSEDDEILGAGVYTPHMALDWSVADVNFSRVVVQQGNAAVPTDWITLLESNRNSIRDPFQPMLIPLDAAARQPYRVIASDLAGNATTVTLNAVEGVVVANAQSGSDGSSTGWQAVQGTVSIGDGATELTLEVVETVRAPIIEHAIEFIGPVADGQLPGATWSQRILPAPTKPATHVLPQRLALDGAFLLNWDMRELTGSGRYFFRVRLTDQDGKIYRSADQELTKGRLLSTLSITTATLESSTLLKVTAEEKLGELVTQINLLAQSGSDPAFIQQRVLWTRPGASTTAGLGTFAIEVTDRFQTCTEYILRLQAVLADGRKIESAPHAVRACTFAETVLKPNVVACGIAPTGTLRVELRAINQIQANVRLGLLEFGRLRANGTDDILYSQVNPTIGTTYTYELSTAPYADGIHHETGEKFFTRVTDIENRQAVHPVRVIVDRTPAEARITYPMALQRICAKPETGSNGSVRGYVELEGTIADTLGFDYLLQYGAGETPAAWKDVVAEPPACLTPANRARALGEPDSEARASLNAEAYRGSTNSTASCGPFRALSGTQVSGGLARLYAQHGSVSARLLARNWSGSQTCSQVTFDVDGKVEAGVASLDRTDIAPGKSDASGTVTLSYNAEESLKTSVTIYRRADVTVDSIGNITGAAANAQPVRRLASERQVTAGADTVGWDGRDDGNSLVEDGLYVMFVRFTDSCGNLRADKPFIITSDRTAPVVSIAQPAASAEVGGIAEVRGSVSDANLTVFRLEFGSGVDPATWTNIANGSQNVSNTTLGSWNTLGLAPGAYTLRLTAVDRFGNTSETRVAVTVRAGGTIVGAFEVVPEVFSPNGDSRLDQAAVRFTLVRAAAVTVTVYQGAAAVRTLASNLAREAGSGAIAFDGLGNTAALADGRYEIELVANDGSVSESVTVPVTIDRVAPVVAISYPAMGVARGNGSIAGSITDTNLLDYTMTLRGIDVPAINVVLDQGSDVRSNYLFASLSGYAEGRYELIVEARDRAENASRVVIPFEIDNTAPKVTLTAPTANAVLGTKGNPFGITASIDERNFSRYRLNLGQGSPPATQTELASGNSLPAVLIHTLDIASLADGSYTLQLIVDDKGGTTTTATTTFTVDKTAPTASITLPVENAYLKLGTEIKGTANDSNLQQYKLEIAAGTKAAASRFTEFAQATTAVTNDVLGNLAALPPDGVHTIRLTVTDKADNAATALVQVTIDTVPPTTPLNLAVLVQNRQDVALSWNAVTDSDLAGYLIYRDGTLLTQAPGASITYTDAGVNEGDHAYTVSAVDHAGNESTRSAPVTARISLSTPTAQIQYPQNGIAVGGVIDIRGSAYSAKDFKEYRVSIGEGASPLSFTLLRRSTIPAQGEVLAQWNTFALAENGTYTIQLEAEDTFGAVDRVLATVRIDNRAPGRPNNLQASLAASDVTLSWSANTEPDLDGYLLYRNGVLANQIGPVATDLKSFLIKSTTYLDKSVQDGTYDYTVVAMDTAGNLSERSSAKRVIVESRPPKAIIAKPLEGSRIDRSTYVLATSEDNDLASVQLQFSAAGASTWIDIGAAITAAPYGREWDLSALALGNYELRAIARDTGNRVDATPAVVRIERARLARPDTPGGLTTRVKGEEITLTWNAVTSPDLAGYVIEVRDPNGDLSRIDAPITGTTYTDAQYDDGLYHYTVLALDTFGNLSDPSAAVPARIFSIEVSQPYTPTDERVTELTGKGIAGLPVKLTITAPSGTRTLTQLAGAQGSFTFPGIALELGDNRFVLIQTDAAGNASREATPHVMVGNKPAKPTGFVGNVVGEEARLSWSANAETDLAGYYLTYGGEPSISEVAITGGDVSSGDVVNLIDDNSSTTWYSNGESQPRAEVELAERALISKVLVYWDGTNGMNDPGYTPAAFEIHAWDGEVFVKVGEGTGNTTDGANQVTLTRPYFTDLIRIQVKTLGTYPNVGISYVSFDTIPLGAATSETYELVNSRVTFAVSAVSTLGLVSLPSDPVVLSQGDTVPPEPVMLQATVSARDVTLTWTASASTDVAGYDIYRDGNWLKEIEGVTTRTTVDSGLANGTYKYTVVAYDQAGNESTPSNEVTVTVAVNVTGQPLNLVASPVASGRAIDLSWSVPASGTTPASYSVERSTQSGTAFAIVAEGVSAPAYRDSGLINGTRYYYRVFALNASGDAGPRSAEASAVPQPSAGPSAPVLVYPASAASPATVTSATATVTGFAEPASLVSLAVNGGNAGTATAKDAPSSYSVNAGEQARLSPDGAWTIGGFNAIRISRIVAGPSDTSSIVKEFTVSNPARAFTWAANSKRAAYVLERYDDMRSEYLRFAGFTDIEELAPRSADAVELSSNEIALSPDGRYGYVLGRRDGRSGLWRIELATNTPLALLDIAEETNSLAISPKGNAIAYIRDGRLEVFDLVTSQIRLQGAPQAGWPNWTSGGDALFYIAMAESLYQVFRLDFSGTPASQITNGTFAVQSLSVSPDAARIVYYADGRLRLRTLASGTEAVLPGEFSNYTRWVDAGYLQLHNGGDLIMFRPPGHFRITDVLFTPGTNRITATATLDGGPPSASSAAAIVNYSTSDRPDLAVSAADIIAIPGVPTIGERVRATVVVKNTGSRTAAPAAFVLQSIDPDGVAQSLIDTRLPSLASGTSTAVVIDWTPTKGGTYKLSATVDRLNEIFEVSESNNSAVRDITVVAAAGVPSLTVNTDASVYPQNAAVAINARVVNGGTDFSGTIELQIEDAQGFAVVVLQPQSVQNLAFGQSLVVARNWNTASTLPGAYRVRAKLKSATGSTVTETTATFAVDAAVAANATVTTDLAQYPQTGTVHLLGRVTFPNGAGAGLSGEALLRVLDAAGQLRFEQVRNLAFGTTADVNADWVFSSQAAGDYTARIEVRLDGRVIASANSAFKIVGVTLLPPNVSLVTPANNVVFGAPARIAISAGASSPNAGGTIAKVEFFSGADKVGEALAAPFAFNWIDVPAGIYSLTARATDNRGASADTPPVNVTVNALPSVAITAPTANSLFQPPATITVTASAQDSDGTIAKVEIFSGTLKLGECALGDCSITWNGVATGAYTLTAVAIDNRGGRTTSAPVVISVGQALLPPTVSLTAPTQGAIAQAPGSFTLAASAASANAGGSIAKVEFFQGTTKLGESVATPYSFAWINVPAGSYALTARATDNRGVSTDSAVVNVSVNVQPTVSITAPVANASFTAPTSIAVTAAAQDSDGTIAKIEIFNGATKLGECATSPCTVQWTSVAAGSYTLTAKATDNRDGSTTSVAVAVNVGQALLPPTISLTAPTEDALVQAPGSFTLTATATSPNSGGSIAKVEFFAGADKLGEALMPPYTFDWTDIPAAQYALIARATDNRGVSTDTAPINVTVNAQPTVSITAPVANASYTAPASISVTASALDSDGTVAKIEIFSGTLKLGECALGDCSITWSGVAAGSYTLTAKATDNRDGSTTSTPVTITVSPPLLAPTVSLTAPAEGAIAQAPGSFTLTASAASPNAGGSIAKAEFFQGTTKLGETATAPYSFVWTNIAAGSYALTARATDNRGVTSDSAGVNVIVNAQPTVSITAPAANTSFTAPATIDVTAVAQDGDGTITKIEVFNGATKLGECLSSPCTVQWTNVAAGSYTLTAKATDNRNGSTTSAPVIVTVSPPLLAPTVSLTAPAEGAVAQAPGSFTLIASAASPNASGSIAKVEFFHGSTKVGEATSLPYSFTLINIAAGSYALKARATDDRGVTTDSVVVNVIVNAQPTVSITAPAANASFNAPAIIAVTATAQDSDGTITKIEIFNGATKLGECLSSPCTVQWTNVAAGSYTLTAKATDNRNGSTTSAPVAVSVGQALLPPTVSLTAPAEGAIAQALGSFTLAASAASPNAGGSIAKVEFFQGATKLGEATAAPYSFAWTSIAAGSYSITARATDNRSVTTDSAAVNVIVNAQPTVSITAPAANTSFTAPANIAVTAAAQDSDGTIAKIEIFNGATKLGECLSSPCTVQWTGVATGSYTLTAKATDNRNGSTTSAPVAVSVGQALLPPTVSLTAPAAGAIAHAPGSFTLSATAASPNSGGSIAKVEFFQGSTKFGEDAVAPYSFAWTNIVTGSYSITARATDNRGVTTDSAIVNVIVNAQPTISITAPAANASFTAPASIAVTATAQDSDGTIAKIEIFNGTTKLGECLSAPCTIQWTGVAAGSYTLTAKATDNRGGSTTSAGVAVTVAAGALSGSIVVTPTTANIGQSVQVSANVTSPSAIANLPLKVRVYNATSGVTLSEWTTNATLAANTQFLWSFNWNTVGQPVGTFKVALFDRRTASDVLIAETTVTLKSAVVAQLSAAITTESRILVLATCYTASGSNDTPDPVCAEQRKAFLEDMLTDMGVVHRVVTDADSFRSELRCGAWNVFWLSGGREKLKDRLAEEIGEEVFAGKGLIVDGINNGVANGIDGILGVKYLAKLAISPAHTVVPVDTLLPAGNFSTGGRASRYQTLATTAIVHARFDSSTGDPAIVSNPYGRGRALMIAFDLAATMQATPSVEANALSLFAKISPTIAEPGTAVKARLTISNSGGAGSASVAAVLPVGVTIRSATPSPSSGTSWQLDFTAGGQRTIDLEFNVPAGEGSYTVRFDSGSQSTTLSLNVVAISGGTHATVVQALNALTLTGTDRTARDKAVTAVNGSAAKLQSDPEGALYLLLDAAKDVAGIASAGAAHEQLAHLAVKTASSWCQQIAVCMRPDQGTAALGSYQVLVFGDASFANGNVEGSIGVSGNAQLANLSIASQWAGDSARLIAGANITWGGNGGIGLNGSGVIRAGANIVIGQNVGRRSATANTQTDDWAGLKSRNLQLSSQLGALTGTAALAESGGKFTFRGTNPTQNVFTLTSAQTTGARSLVFDVPLSSSVIVNVTGTSATFTNGQQYIMQNGQQQAMQQHSFATHVLFNFPQATAITVANWSVQGTVLAPKARLTQANGNLFGQLIVDTLTTSNMQFQQCGTFRGTLP